MTRRTKTEQRNIFTKISRMAVNQDLTIGDACRKHNISTATYFTWRKKYGKHMVGRKNGKAAKTATPTIETTDVVTLCGNNQEMTAAFENMNEAINRFVQIKVKMDLRTKIETLTNTI